MRTAVVYYSLGGNTAFAASRIAEIMQADLILLETVEDFPKRGLKKFWRGGQSVMRQETPALKPYTFDPEAYDLVILGFPVWAGYAASPLRTFVLAHREALAHLRLGSFACQGGSGGHRAFIRLAQCIGISAIPLRLILNDPLERPAVENDKKIRMFCEACLEPDPCFVTFEI